MKLETYRKSWDERLYRELLGSSKSKSSFIDKVKLECTKIWEDGVNCSVVGPSCIDVFERTYKGLLEESGKEVFWDREGNVFNDLDTNLDVDSAVGYLEISYVDRVVHVHVYSVETDMLVASYFDESEINQVFTDNTELFYVEVEA